MFISIYIYVDIFLYIFVIYVDVYIYIYIWQVLIWTVCVDALEVLPHPEGFFHENSTILDQLAANLSRT